jgi:hypothetical protein
MSVCQAAAMSTHKTRILSFGLVVVMGMVGCQEASVPGSGVSRAEPPFAPVSQPASLPMTPPRNAEECKACNGIWGVNGISQVAHAADGAMSLVESCNCRTHDGGKRCRDGADCEGMCVAADAPEREIVDKGPPARGFFVGRCSDMVAQFGCILLIGRGVTARGPQPLDVPPARVCVD